MKLQHDAAKPHNNLSLKMKLEKVIVAAAIFVSCQIAWAQTSPQVSLYFEPQQVLEGETSHLRLVAAHADSCQTSEGDSLELDESGTSNIKYEDISEKITSKVICKNAYGSTEKVAYLRLNGSSGIDELIAAAASSGSAQESEGENEVVVTGVDSNGFWISSFFDSFLSFFKNLFTNESELMSSVEPSAFAGATSASYDLTVDRLGAAVYSLPISAPNGTGGVKPNISAIYNSQSPNGLLGKGGSLGGLSVIKRCPQTLVRDNANKAITWTAEDRFCIDAQRLILITGTQGEAESQYKTEIDNGVVYTAKGGTSGNPDYFEARAQDNATLIFGGSATAKELGGSTMTWALTQYKDAANNAIEYVYEGTAADGLRIKQINYAFPEANTTVNPGAYIEFIYKDRDDSISKYVAGYEFRNNKLLTQINSYSLPGILHRSYQLDYATSSGLAGYVSRWQGVDECTTHSQCFSTNQFVWGNTRTDFDGKTEIKNIGISLISSVAKHGHQTYSIDSNYYSALEAVDLNGNGLNDLVWTEIANSDNARYIFAAFDTGVLPFDADRLARRYALSSESSIRNQPRVEVGDTNADGGADLWLPQYYSDGRTNWSGQMFGRPYKEEWSASVAQGLGYAQFVKTADFNGDGYDDLISFLQQDFYGSSLSVNFSSFSKNTTLPITSNKYFSKISSTPLSFNDVKNRPSDEAFQFPTSSGQPAEIDMATGDFDGDGRIDIVANTAWENATLNKQTLKLNWYSIDGTSLIFKGNVYEETKNYLSRYYTDRYLMSDALNLYDLQAPDINGDGLSDVAFRINATTWKYAINTGKGFKPLTNIFSSDSESVYARNYRSTAFFDVNVDGSKDFVWYKYNATTKNYEIYVKYWSEKESGFLPDSLLRLSVNQPFLFADMNGDKWLDIIEHDQAARSSSQEYLKIYGYSNDPSSQNKNSTGVLTQDSIVEIKTGLRAITTIEYQTLLRPAKQSKFSCTSRSTYTPFDCQDHWGASQYKPLKVDVALNPNTLDAVSVDNDNFYTKNNEPFNGLNNLHAGQARVFQHVAPLPIVTRIKKLQDSNVVSDKKYYSWIMRNQAGGRGLLGFEKTLIDDQLSGNRVETSWRQDWPYTGIVTSQTTYTKFGKLLAEQSNQLNLAVTNTPTGKVFSPRIEQVTAKTYELKAGGAEQGNLIGNVTASAQNSSVKAIDNVTANTSSASANTDIGEPSEYKLDIDRMGASVYRLPISAPNGIGGVKPNISAIYNSQSPNGLLGKGGSLGGLSVIKRCPQTLVRDNANKVITWTAEDRFCIDTQRLILIAGTQGEAESQYKTEIDNGVVYTAKGGTSGNPDYFEARAQDNATLIFGGSATAKEQGGATMTWALTQYKDAANNAIEYVYEDTAADGLRIKQINYAFPEKNTTTNPGAYIEFIYKDREDPIAKFVAGYEFRTNKLLTQINSYTLPGLLYRSYQLDYAASSGLAGYVNRLQSIDECAALNQCFSASQFTWGNTQVNASGVTELKDINIGWLQDVTQNGYGLSSIVRADFVDLNGNGIADLVLEEQNSSKAMTFTAFDPAVPAIDSDNRTSYRTDERDPTQVTQTKPFSFADINADGVSDLLTGGYVTSEYLRSYGSTQARSKYQWYLDQNYVPLYSGYRYNFYGDFDGDGLIYQLLIGREIKRYSQTRDFWVNKLKKNTTASAEAAKEMARYFNWTENVKATFSDITAATVTERVELPTEYGQPGNIDMAVADFNGDGKSDLVTYTSWHTNSANQTDYKLNWYSWNGTQFNLQGNIYTKTQPGSYYENGNMYDATYLKDLTTPDINGDGLADVSYRFINNSPTSYALSKGNAFTTPVVMNNPLITRAYKVWYHDINQDGSADFIFATSDVVSGVTQYTYYVSYWNAMQSKYLDPVVLRTTTNTPIVMADANGDAWVDFVEYDPTAKNAGKPYIRIYGFTNALSTTNNNHGVFTRDVIVGIKTGIRKFESIEYQTLARPATVKTKTCINPAMACQDFYGSHHYEYNRIKGVFATDSLTATEVDEKSYYRKANDPFAGLSNPYAETARVTQVINTMPIAIRTKTIVKQAAGDVLVSDKKYFYNSLRTQAGGRGLLGFEKTTVEDLLTGKRTETSWRQDWPYTGIIGKLEEKNLQGATLREADNQLTLKAYTESSGLKIFSPAVNGQLVKRYAAPLVAGQTGRLLSTELIGLATSSSSSSAKSSSSVKSVSSSSSAIARPVSLELTAPGEGAVLNYESGASIPLSAVVKAADGSIWKDTDGLPPKVVFYDYWTDSVRDETRLYQKLAMSVADGVPVYWTPDSQGMYAIRAMAYLNDGTILYSKLAGVWINRPVGTPAARLIATSYGYSYPADWTFNFAVDASDEDGIENVSFYANDNFIGNGTSINGSTAPRFDWKPTVLGAYQIYALVKDKTGKVSKTKTMLANYGIPSVENKIPLPVRDRYPYMTEALPYPAYFYTLGSDVYLSSQLKGETNTQWKEADNSIPVAKFYASDIYVAESAASGYATTWRPTLAAAYEMTAISKLKNNELVVSPPSTLLVAQATAPRALLTAPAYSGISYYQGQLIPVSVTANAMTGSSINKVVFYANDEEIGTDTTAPYSLSWMPPATGLYRLKAHVVDSKGVVGVSAQRDVRYLNQGTSNSLATINEPLVAVLNAANDQYFDGLSSAYRLRVTAKNLPENPLIEIFAKPNNATSWSYSPWVSVEPGAEETLAAPAGVSVQSDASGVVIFAINGQSIGGYDYRARICDRVTFNCSVFSDLTSVNLVAVSSSSSSANSQASGNNQSASGDTSAAQNSSAASSQALKLALMSPQTSFTEKYGLGAEVVLGAYLVGPGYSGGLDVNGKAAAVDFYANGVLLSGLPPYPSSNFLKGWTPTAAGKYAIHAVHRMQNGTTLISPTGYMEFTQTGAPVISISSPVTNQQLVKDQAATISASVSDPENNVGHVTFYVNNVQVGERDFTAPYSVDWTPTSSGSYTIYAVALDNTLLKTTSVAVNVNVQGNSSMASSSISNSSRASSSAISTVVGNLSAYPINGAIIENFANAPCFQWPGATGINSYQITLATSSNLGGQKWTKTIGQRSVCWGNGLGWNSASDVPELLSEGSTYYWQVTGSAGGNTYTSAIQSFVVGASGLPAIPQITSAPIQAIGSFTLDWSPVGAVKTDYFNLREKSNGQVNVYSNLSTRSYILTPLNAMVYEYSLQACNAKGCSDFSAPVRVMANPFASLASPALVSPVDNSIINVSGASPCFQWSTVTGATSYNVTINTDGHFPVSRWQKISTTGTSICWDGGSGWSAGGVQKPADLIMKEGAAYYWRVVAVKGSNEAYGFSQTRSFRMTSGIAEAPVAPAAIAVEPSASSFSVSWRSVSGVSYYELQRASSGDPLGFYAAEWSAGEKLSATSTLVSGLVDFNLYRWRVRACNSANLCSAWKVSESKVYQPITSLTPVVPVLPERAAVLGGNPCFEWTPNAATTGHIVTVSVGDYFPAQRWSKSVASGNRVCWNNGEGWESAGLTKLAVPKNLQPGVPYQWRVVSGDSAGRQARSETRSFVVDTNNAFNADMLVPALSVIDADQDCFYIVNMGAAANVPFSYVYELYEKKSSDLDWQLVVSKSKARGNIPPFMLYSDADIFSGRYLSGGAYDYRARICEGDNCGAFSSVLSVNTSQSCKNVAMPVVNFEPLISTAVVGQDNLLSVSATTTQGTISHVNFYAGGQLIGTDTAAPFSVNWKPTIEGTTHIEAIAETSTGGTGSTHFKSVNVIAQPAISDTGNFDFAVKQNVYNLKFDLSWKPVAGHTRYELWQRSSGRLDDLYESGWKSYAISAAEYGAGVISIPVNSIPDALYVQWKLVVCDAAINCKSQLSKVKTLQYNPVATITESLTPANNATVDFDKAENNLCFDWSKDPNAVLYTVAVSDVPEFPERRWQQSVSKDNAKLCWGNVNDWTRAGVYRNELPEDLKIGGTYFWRVVINYADGSQGFSNTNQFTLSSNVPHLDVTTNLVAQNFELKWNKVNARFYQLQVRVGNNMAEVEAATAQQIPLIDSTATTVIEPMANYKNYLMMQWQVRACQSATNCGAWQSSRIKTNQYGATLSGINLTAPANGSPIDIAINQSIPCFKWSADANATDYVVTVSDTPEFTERRWAKTANATEVCWDSGNGWSAAGIYKDELHQSLYRGFKYYWRVVSRYSNGGLGFSQTYSFDVTDSSEPVIALLAPKPLDGNRVFIDTQVPVMANVFDTYMRNWRNVDGRQPLVDYYLNNALLPGGYRVSAGIPVQWHPINEGTYKIKAVAYLDDAKTLKTLEAEIHVVKPQAPTIVMQASGSANAGIAVDLNAVVTDPDQQIEQITFYANGEPVGKVSNAPPYKTSWTPVVAGNYALVAKMVDKRGKETVSAVKNATVHPTLFSIDGLNLASDFGNHGSYGWSVMSLKHSDMLTVNASNNSRISYNKFSKLLLNRPLKIINRSDVYANGIVPQLIVVDADQVELNAGIEIIGEPADLLIINSSTSNNIRCKNCGFINVQRAVLAVATPAAALSAAMTQVGQLQTRVAGTVDINNLQASGVVSLEVIADRVVTKGQINTQQYARQSTEVNSQSIVEPVLDFVVTPDINSVVVGSGGVSLLQGNFSVNYETMALENTVAGTGVMDLQAAIYSGAIKVFAADAIQLGGNLSTRSSHRAAQIYRGQLRAQEEQIQLKTIAQATTAPGLRISGNVLSDAKVSVIGHSADIRPTGSIQAHSVKMELIGQLMNRGFIRGYVRATTENAANGEAMLELGAGSVDNRGEIRGVFNNLVMVGGATSIEGKINIASEGDVYNRFGGSITAKTINIIAKGKIRNGSLYAFDDTASGGKESTTVINIAPHDTSRLSTHDQLNFSLNEAPLKNTTARIAGDEVTLQAARSVENINPYTEPYSSAAVEISSASEEAERHANDVEIEAVNKLQIFSNTYVLNSSAKLGVSQPGATHLLAIKAPQVRNERYYTNLIVETFSDFTEVKAQSNGRDATVQDWAKGIQSRYGFYSPPGYIYSFARVELDFGDTGNGLLNNISYVDFYSDLKVFGLGKITTRGISLEKMSYESGNAIQVSIPECQNAFYQGHQNYQSYQWYYQCAPRTTYKSTPEGKLIKQSPDNTLFAVNGEASAPANAFNARNDQSLMVLRKKVIAEYIEARNIIAAQLHANDIRQGDMDPACIQSVNFEEKDNILIGTRRQFSDLSHIRCYHSRAFGSQNVSGYASAAPYTWSTSFGNKNITELINENIPVMGTALNTQIENYRAWRNAAQ
ncbi:Ig-like domain-containing protein [Cellvibrio mixtus]|uniref:Ig-like domain-containing protein n=1 Tax=Cellvibrio mixtus TaxID=39650 RepID=UPI000586AB18|nr:Ig-like domain-containing protein [Cellvibrio mixtus]